MDLKELRERQSWTLRQKIDHSLGVIDQFVSRLNGQVYVGFSGGKDSTVLLDLCRIVKPDIKAVFCNTGNEYPDIVRFVRELKNTEGYDIEIIYPTLKPAQVFEKYGFPIISKEVSEAIYAGKHSPLSVKGKNALGLLRGRKFKGEIPLKYRRFIRVQFDINNKCCYALKKQPSRLYQKKYRAISHIGDYGIRVKIKAAKLPKTRRLQFFRRENDKVITSINLA